MGTDEMEIDELEDIDDAFGSELDVDLIDVDLDNYCNWELREETEWGLTDGESESAPSEGDMNWNDPEPIRKPKLHLYWVFLMHSPSS